MLLQTYICRYYNSWIETSEELAVTDTSSSMLSLSTTNPSSTSIRPTTSIFNSIGLLDNIEKNAPPAVQPGDSSIEWSVDFRNDNFENSDDEDEEEDENDVFGASFLPQSDSEDEDGIVFENAEKCSEMEIDVSKLTVGL